MGNLFRKKDIDECMNPENSNRGLKRSLGPVQLIIMGIGAIIGAGIFIVTGIASATAGPALVLSFIIAAIACVLTALCYAEFASMFPISGSVYTYTYVAMGEVWAWMIGWVLMFEYLISSAAIAVGWSGYIVSLLNSTGIILPQIITNPLGEGGLINLPAFLIIALLTGILIIGTHHSAKVNTAIVIIKLTVIGLFIYVGAQFINPSNYHPFMPFGWLGVLQGAALIFFAYIGFDAVSTAAEETINPQRSLPIGIIGSLIICSILYIVVAVVLNGMVPYNSIDFTAPVAFALEKVGANWAASIISVGALFGLTSVLLTLLFGQTRIFYSMSKDGLLPATFSKIHPKFRTPLISTLIVGGIAAFFASFFPLTIIIKLVNIGTLSAFIFLALSIIILRKQHPDIKREFKCPLVPAVPILSIIFCVGLIFNLDISTLERFAVSLIIGLAVYFVYGVRNSKLRDKKTVENENIYHYELKGYKFNKRNSK
jgi:basic amino acid/polyamine antiporter, APA family